MRLTALTFVLMASLAAAPVAVRADAASDHATLAAQYEKEASADREQAQMHRRMLDHTYKAPAYSKVQRVDAMKGHCERLIKYYEDAAAEADALAKEHREAAAAK